MDAVPGASLLNAHVRSAMLRQCKPQPRQGRLIIEGSYDPLVIQQAFEDFGEWDTSQKKSYTRGELVITQQDRASQLLAFQV